MGQVMKILGLMVFSAIKFFFAPSTVYLSGYTFMETVAITTSGGILGVLAFFYFGEILKYIISKFIPFRKKKPKKKFTKRNRKIIRIKEKYGLFGLAILTPSLFSIPLGSLLAARYFDKDKRTLPVMMISVVFWSFLLTTITHLIGH